MSSRASVFKTRSLFILSQFYNHAIILKNKKDHHGCNSVSKFVRIGRSGVEDAVLSCQQSQFSKDEMILSYKSRNILVVAELVFRVLRCMHTKELLTHSFEPLTAGIISCLGSEPFYYFVSIYDSFE